VSDGYDIPAPDDIADQIAAGLEEGLKTAPDGSPRVIDARSERSVFAVLARVVGLALHEVYLFLAWVVAQIFPDGCDDRILPIHARIWGVERQPAAKAIGSVIFRGVAGTPIAAGQRLSLSGGVWTTLVAAVIGGGGSVTVAVEAIVDGAVGNSPAGAQLALTVPIVGLAVQTAEVAAGGLVGGIDLETIASWRARLIARIREPPHGGAEGDYPEWVRAAVPAAKRIKVHRNWIGAGTVGVVFACVEDDGSIRAPTVAEVAAVQAHLGTANAPGVAPVTATVVALAATLRPVAVTAQISPFSTQVELAVAEAIAKWFLSADMQIAASLHLSRLRERLSRAAGEDWHRLALPAADVDLGPLEIAVPGAIVVEEAT